MYYYLIHVQYLGIGFHGWAKQTNVRTVHHAIDKTINYVFDGKTKFKTLGCSRTDAKVSANHYVLELFMHELVKEQTLMEQINAYLPSDIRILSIEETNAAFNIIQDPKEKEYHYLFAFGQKAHPFAAPFMGLFTYDLNIALMKEGAQLFEGKHNFRKYCFKPSETVTDFEREITYSRIEENNSLTASFFPDKSFVFKVRGKGFMRNQIRLMMGQLLQLGKGETDLKALEDSIINPTEGYFTFRAPASGLTLNKVAFD